MKFVVSIVLFERYQLIDSFDPVPTRFLPSFESDSKRWLIVMWGFVFVQNPDSSVLYEQFKSNLVDVPAYMRHVVALHLAQQGRFP